LKIDQKTMTSMISVQITLSLVRNANNSGSDLKETVRLAVLHLQKTETGNAAKTITTLLGFAQAIAETDNWKKVRDAAGGEKYIPLSKEWIQKLFGIIARQDAKGGRKTARSGGFSRDILR